MAHISDVPEDQATGATAELFENVRAGFGYLPNMARAFAFRPEYWSAWEVLLTAIKARMTPHRYEVVTVAAAVALKSSYCALAHGQILARDILDEARVQQLVADPGDPSVDREDRAVYQFAQKVIRDASAVTEADAGELRKVGLDDGEICDVAAAASVRCFFSKYLDSLGFQPDHGYLDLPGPLREVLTVGRAIETGEG